MDLINYFQGILHPLTMALTVTGKQFGSLLICTSCQWIYPHWPVRIKSSMPIDIFSTQKIVYQFLFRDLDFLNAIREIVAIIANINREHNLRVLSYLIGHNDCICDFLIALTIKLYPTCLFNGHSILLPPPNALRRDTVSGN